MKGGNRWRKLAERALEQLVKNASDRTVHCGYTMNTDVVTVVDPATLAAQLRESAGATRASGVSNGVVVTLSDLAEVVEKSVREGLGSEWPVGEASVLEWLRSHLAGQLRVGGTGAQVADNVSALGFASIVNAPVASYRQLALLTPSSRLWLATPHGLVLRSSLRSTPDDEPPVYHFILEFLASARVAERLILPYDPDGRVLRICDVFIEATLVPMSPPPRLVISGFNAPVLESERLMAFIERVRGHLLRYRSVHPGAIVHLELGKSHRASIRRRVLEEVVPLVDSLGMNIEEAVQLVRDLDIDHLAASLQENPALVCREVRSALGVSRLNIHSPAWTISALALEGPIGEEMERLALTAGTLLAAARASLGRSPTLEELHSIAVPIPVHPDGVAFVETLEQRGWEDMGVVAIPARQVLHPKLTVGLGDAFTAGIVAVI
ncbi:MAG: hypothetical protein IMX01_10475 [Limnochordaceae bacterium]|nr:hypothetical protein [Limnochordaceae bacterium]